MTNEIIFAMVFAIILWVFWELHKLYARTSRSWRRKKGINKKKYKQKCTKQEIYSLDLLSETTGSFFLGLGGISAEQSYYFYIGKEGGKQLDSVSANNTIIKESNDIEPNITHIEWNYQDDWTIDNEAKVTDTKHILHVPIGTIKREFKGNIK